MNLISHVKCWLILALIGCYLYHLVFIKLSPQASALWWYFKISFEGLNTSSTSSRHPANFMCVTTTSRTGLCASVLCQKLQKTKEVAINGVSTFSVINELILRDVIIQSMVFSIRTPYHENLTLICWCLKRANVKVKVVEAARTSMKYKCTVKWHVTRKV